MAKSYTTDIAIIGGGLAGIVCALEILEASRNTHVTILDRDRQANFGGLARLAFGGMALVGTPWQKRQRIPDSVDKALADWHRFAEFGAGDVWPKAWAKYYVEHCNEKVFHWLKERGVGFFPAVQWAERGLFTPGNSLPRYHLVWGTAAHMTARLIARLRQQLASGRLRLLFEHRVDELSTSAGVLSGCEGVHEPSGERFSLEAGLTVVASGGLGGNLERVRANWPADWTQAGAGAPELLLNGAHPLGDGRVHDAAQRRGALLTHLDKMWNYPAGIPHPEPAFPGHGLSLIPTRSSLWMNHRGERIGPLPLITGFDTRFLCQQVAAQEKPWTWQVMNWRIAARELAVSGAQHNPLLRDRRWFKFVLSMLLGDDSLISELAASSDHIVLAHSLEELVEKMNATTDSAYVSLAKLRREMEAYDARVRLAPRLQNDDQIRRIAHLRNWLGDKIRTCAYQPIGDNSALPYVAIKTHLITRKTLGGIQTNLDSAVLGVDGQVIAGLYAIGEAAGFGGGGASGKRSLEGTFLPGCIMTAQNAARAIVA